MHYIIKNKPVSVVEKFRRLPHLAMGISTISAAELEYGVARSRFPDQNREALSRFLLPLIIVPFEIEDARAYGEIRQALQAEGPPIGAMDMLIAAQARQREVVLVTNNIREFAQIDQLRLETWVAGR